MKKENTVRIIKANETIPVDHPVFLLYGQPGICKSSLGFSMKVPLLLDFDKGAHRAANRRDTLIIDNWKDADLASQGEALAPYSSVVVDTVGRCLDVITSHIAATEPKKCPGGTLTMQGWGVLKNYFRNWMSAMRGLGKDVLLIAHDKEDKDGETRIVRPDIAGGSYAEIFKVADFVGYASMSGKQRILDFNPTDKWIGKNPAQWAPFEIPPIAKAGDFMAKLFDDGRSVLGKISEESSTVVMEVEFWREEISKLNTVHQFNVMIVDIKKLSMIVQVQLAKILLETGDHKGFVFDREKKQFVAPASLNQAVL
jgi:AAA domain